MALFFLLDEVVQYLRIIVKYVGIIRITVWGLARIALELLQNYRLMERSQLLTVLIVKLYFLRQRYPLQLIVQMHQQVTCTRLCHLLQA